MSPGRVSPVSEWISEDGLLLIKGWARDGLRNEDIAKKKIGVSQSTFYKWKSEHSEIAEALKKGRAPIDEEVEDTLYNLCRVQKYTEAIVEEDRDPESNTVIRRHVKKITREQPPVVSAVIFVLRNRKKHRWSNNPEATVVTEESVDDGFVAALNATAKEDWNEDG